MLTENEKNNFIFWTQPQNMAKTAYVFDLQEEGRETPIL